jgi:hypothetical protein
MNKILASFVAQVSTLVMIILNQTLVIHVFHLGTNDMGQLWIL